MSVFKRLSGCSPEWLAGVLLLVLAAASPVHAGAPQPAAVSAPEPARATGLRYEDDTLRVRLVIRTPDQLTAFYIGRGFNQAAIDKILETCFITPIVFNKTFDVLWLDLDDWRFGRDDTVIRRLGRDYWPARWQEAGLPQAQQSTFGWTLLPEVRDLRPDEGAGGSVVIPMQDKPFTLTMRFHTGGDRQGPVKTVIFEDLRCSSNPSPP